MTTEKVAAVGYMVGGAAKGVLSGVLGTGARTAEKRLARAAVTGSRRKILARGAELETAKQRRAATRLLIAAPVAAYTYKKKVEPAMQQQYYRMKYGSANGLLSGDFDKLASHDLVAAQNYFDESQEDMAPTERFVFANNLSLACKEASVTQASDLVEKHASAIPDAGILREELEKRCHYMVEKQAEDYMRTVREVATTRGPIATAIAMEQMDKEASIHSMWGEELRDPFRSVFGGSDQVKTAEYSWSSDTGQTVSEDKIKHIGNGYSDKIDKILGEGQATEFAKDPVGVFKSMPDPIKQTLANFASMVSGGDANA